MTPIASQLARYPAMQPTDLMKLCYQAEFGCGHLLTDREAARAYLHREMRQTPPSSEQPLMEEVGGGHARLHLAAAKAVGIEEALIFDIFSASALPCGSAAGFRARLEEALCLIDRIACSFTREELAACIAGYDFTKLAPIGHSEAYRTAYHPAYRVIDMRYITQIAAMRKP